MNCRFVDFDKNLIWLPFQREWIHGNEVRNKGNEQLDEEMKP